MIQLDKQTTPIINDKGETIGWNTQAVLLPNHFFLDPGITCDWVNNTCTLDGNVYYLDKGIMKSSTAASIPSESEWLNTYGNRIEHELYDFVDMENNPSGNENNYYRTKYIDNRGRTKYIIEYTYDDRDNCLSQVSIAPDGAEAEHDKEIVVLTKYALFGKQNIKCVKGSTMYISPDATVPNMRFVGWKFNGELLPTNDKGAAIIVMNDNYEINAYHIHTYVVYVVNGSSLISMESVDEKSVVPPPSIVLPDQDDKYFDGWGDSNGNRITEPVVANSDIYFHSIYLPWLWATISSNDGELYSPLKFRKGEALTLESLSEIIEPGASKQMEGKTYTFDGWYLADQKFGDDMPEVSVEEDITVEARWIITE